jgi:hypothetical protein
LASSCAAGPLTCPALPCLSCAPPPQPRLPQPAFTAQPQRPDLPCDHVLWIAPGQQSCRCTHLPGNFAIVAVALPFATRTTLGQLFSRLFPGCHACNRCRHHHPRPPRPRAAVPNPRANTSILWQHPPPPPPPSPPRNCDSHCCRTIQYY